MNRVFDARTSSNTPTRQRHLGFGSERGQSLVETAMILPIVLLVAVGIFEFGRVFQTIQVMTNAAREGARVAVLPATTEDQVKARVKEYLKAGELGNWNTAAIDVDQSVNINLGGGASTTGSLVTVDYPFSFMILNPVAKVVVQNTKLGEGVLTLTTSAEMRNEVP
jgi:Flp pilus assembly protein TadG